MNHRVLYALGVPGGFRAVTLLLILAQAAALQWMLRLRGRQSTFFSVRVQPGFIDSNTGRAILTDFRLRFWAWTALVAAIYSLGAWTNWFRLGMSYLLVTALAAVMLGFQLAYAKAYRRTCREGNPLTEPSMRSAMLFAEDERTSPWLTTLDWMGIVIPVALPVATIIFLGLHGSQPFSQNSSRMDLADLIFAAFIGIFPSTTQLALRFRARSSDWAPDPGRSHKYRTFLGVMQASVFTFLILQLCILSLVRTVSMLPDMNAYFRFSFAGYLALIPVVLMMRFWLKRNFAAESGDPMPDHFWKWGWFYFSPSDPALIVPLRAGVGYSFNYARPSVWVVGTAIAIALVLGLARFARLT